MNSIDFSKKKRVVIKVGTSSLTHATGNLNLRRMSKFVEVLADIKNSGKEILLVSSGAIAVGVGKLGLKERPREMEKKQACAAIGQCELMNVYDNLFSQYNQIVAQVLLTRDVIEHETRKTNVINTLKTLIDEGAVPIINENDTVSIEEIAFGENDTLSALVAILSDSDLLVIITDVDGLYDENPKKSPNAHLITTVDEITDEILNFASGKGSEFSSGGMQTKLYAAKIAQEAGIETVLLNGNNFENLYDLFDNKAECTVITANAVL